VVRAVYVHPEAARQGVGRALMGWIERAMAAAGHARATLLATLPGLPLYRRLGWRDGERVVLRLPCGAALPAVGMDKALVAAGAAQLQAA
jgi:GNAT superfamily N-acetyltransferase